MIGLVSMIGVSKRRFSLEMNRVLVSVLAIVLSCHVVCAEDSTIQIRMIPCRYDSDCIENAYCKDQMYCLCKTQFIVYVEPNGTFSCLKEASAFNDTCVQDIQCTKPFGVDAACRQGRCQCQDKAHFKEGRCYETSLLGQKCKVTNNCKIVSDIGVFCDRSVCVCPQLHHPNSMGTDCVLSSYIGEPCISDDQCLTNNSRCGDVCRCNLGYVVSQDQLRCLKAADKEGDHCEENAQCNEFLRNMRCLKGTCYCDINYHSVPPQWSYCWRSIGLGNVCADSNECVVTSNDLQAASCVQGACQCSSGYAVDAEDSKNCVQKSGNGRQMPHSTSIIGLLFITFIAKFLIVT